MAILEDVKLALRLSNDVYDSEITSIIAAAKIDLEEGGAANTDDTDDLVKRAIILYSKANFGMNNPDMEKFDKMYTKLKITMALTETYQGGA